MKGKILITGGAGFIDKHEFTNKTMFFMVHSLVEIAKKLKKNPYSVNFKKLEKEAKSVSA